VALYPLAQMEEKPASMGGRGMTCEAAKRILFAAWLVERDLCPKLTGSSALGEKPASAPIADRRLIGRNGNDETYPVPNLWWDNAGTVSRRWKQKVLH
jgi:hypothetical protein